MESIMRHYFFALSLILALAFPIASIAQDAEPTTTETVKESAQELATEVQQEVTQAADSVAETVTEATDAEPHKSSLARDIKKARKIIISGSGDNDFVRGMIIGLLQPIFLAAMFCLGLWSGQMSEKLKHIWVLPVAIYVATAIGVFISIYHTDWKPSLDNENFKFLTHLQSMDAVAVMIGVIIGAAVAMQFAVTPIIALAVVAAAGLFMGFSTLPDINTDQTSLMSFWAGLGLTGLLVNIFGIGFETFFQSINLRMITRLVGIATAVLSIFMAVKIF
jgi:hydrogenase/urease accessory protein HupE